LSQGEVADNVLAHVICLDDSGPREQLSDAERVMLPQQNRLGTFEQVKALEARGYKGVYAFEPFSPELAQRSEADIERE
ncbi:inosose isomerase, partial [Klebsiella pneumoniae]|nr:inosose isomerase [Klebsiella pneumoniae]